MTPEQELAVLRRSLAETKALVLEIKNDILKAEDLIHSGVLDVGWLVAARSRIDQVLRKIGNK